MTRILFLCIALTTAAAGVAVATDDVSPSITEYDRMELQYRLDRTERKYKDTGGRLEEPARQDRPGQENDRELRRMQRDEVQEQIDGTRNTEERRKAENSLFEYKRTLKERSETGKAAEPRERDSETGNLEHPGMAR